MLKIYELYLRLRGFNEQQRLCIVTDKFLRTYRRDLVPDDGPYIELFDLMIDEEGYHQKLLDAINLHFDMTGEHTLYPKGFET